jgi:hypothetical protein
MGRRDRLQNNPVIHRTKLFKGIATAEEVHAQHGFRQRCMACGGPPVIQIKTFVQLMELIVKQPRLAAEIARRNPDGPFIPSIPSKLGNLVLVAKVAACKFHQKELEKQAAKAPSYFIVEIDRGPGADKPIVQVAG